MNHLTMEELLELREPGLEPGTATAREHFAACPVCQEEALRLSQRMARLKALPVPRPGRDQFPQVRGRFLREGYVANKIAHPGVVQVLDDDVTKDGLVFLVMELLQGATVNQRWVQHSRRLPPEHVLALADPEQILTVSWLAADPEESLFAAEARRHTLNYGTAEELLKFTPDVVLAGIYTSPFTRAMLRRLGYRVVELTPEASVADIARNVRLVAELVGQTARGEQLVAQLHDDARAIDANRPARALATVVVRPGGFTVGVDNLSHETGQRVPGEPGQLVPVD